MGQETTRIPLLTRTVSKHSITATEEGSQAFPSDISRIMLQFLSGEVVTLYIDSSLSCQELKIILYQ